MRTSFDHQPEAQHPKSPAIETPAGRIPHLSEVERYTEDADQVGLALGAVSSCCSRPTCSPVQNNTSFFFRIFSKILRKYFARCGAWRGQDGRYET
jgi:hypothetical protein